MQKKPRKQKSKKDIVSDIQLVQTADRVRSLTRDILFPHLIGIGESVAYSKLFIQTTSGLIDGQYEKLREKTCIRDIMPSLVKRLDEIFTKSDPEQKKEYGRYLSLLEKIGEVSISDFSKAAELPRFIDGWMMRDRNKEPISSINMDEILG